MGWVCTNTDFTFHRHFVNILYTRIIIETECHSSDSIWFCEDRASPQFRQPTAFGRAIDDDLPNFRYSLAKKNANDRWAINKTHLEYTYIKPIRVTRH